MKKALSLFLALVMVFGIVAVAITETPHVHAEENEVFRWNDFEYTIENGEACIVKYYDSEYRSEYQIIPDTLGGYPVTSIGDEAFAESNNVITFVIPENIKVIGEMAFRHCEILKRVEIKGDLDSIGYGAFMVCKKLSTIILPENIKSIGESAFYNTAYTNLLGNQDYQGGVYCCNYLIAIKDYPLDGSPVFSVREGTVGIAGGIGDWNDNILEVYIPDSVKFIGTNPFDNFCSLQKFSLDENNPYFEVGDDGALYSEDGKTLVSVLPGQYNCCYSIKDGVEVIIENAVLEPNIYIPESVKKICGNAILSCKLYYQGNASEWQNVELSFTNDPETYNEIVNDIRIAYTAYNSNYHRLIKKTDNMRYCSCGKSANIIADHCDNIRAENGFTYIPDPENSGVKVIGYAYNYSTDPVVIPETLGGRKVTSIGNYAFDNCLATSISIPKYVVDIDERGFAYIGGNLEKFIMAESNDHFATVDGVLYDNAYGYPVLFRYPTNAPMEELILERNAVAIMYYAFANTKNLKKVFIPQISSMAALGYNFGIVADYAFYNSSVETVTFEGNALFWMCNNVFEGSKLTEINLPTHICKLGSDVFKNTPITNNEENYDEDGVLYYDNWLIATLNVAGPESYNVKDDTVIISGGAFNWTNLKELTIAKSVVNVGVNPTMYCPKFEEYTVAKGNQYITADEQGVLYVYYNRSQLNNGREIVAYPVAREETCYVIGNVSKIRERAFANTKYLKNVYIPSGVEEIGVYVFGTRNSSAYMIHYGSDYNTWNNNVTKATSDILVQPDITPDLYMYYNHYDNTTEHTVTKDVTVEPTCTEDGCIKTVCSCGYEFVSETYESSDHTWVGDWVITEDPTCTTNGIKENTCSVCGETVMYRIIKLGHDNVLVSQNEGTCEIQGSSTYKCNRCGEVTTEYDGDFAGHIDSGEFITVEATCISEGGKFAKCSVCKKAYGDAVEVYPATGEHTASEWITEKEATCTQEGVAFVKCTVCDAKLEIKAVNIIPHEYMVDTVSSDCTEITKKYTCAKCYHSYTETTKTGKDHIYVKKTDEPTCIKEGRTYFKCNNCDEIEVISTTPALGHKGGEWVVTKQATCQEKGTETQYCTLCNIKIKTKTIPTTEHNMVRHLSQKHSCTYATFCVSCSNCSYFYMEDIMGFENTVYGENEWGIGHIVKEVVVEPTCTEKGKTYRECTVCGYVVDVISETENFGHEWTEAVTKEATCQEDGIITKTCSLCGGTEEEAIPRIAHTFGKWEYESGNVFSGKCAVCNETFDSLEVELVFNQNEVSLYNQTSKVLSVTVTENISDDIIFTSSDSDIVHVYSNGKITAKAPGHATITAQINGTEIKAECRVTVTPRNFGIEWNVDGEVIDYSFVEEGSVITVPEAPEKSGFVFVGWTPEIPEVMPSQSLSFTAVYNIVSQSPDYDVSATYSVDAFNEPVSLNVNEIEGEREPGGVYMVDGENYNQVGLYNIKAVNETEEVVQPNEGHTVRIRLAIPEQYRSRTSFVIYHRFVDGTREQLSTAKGNLWIEDGYLVFDVSCFSEFEVLAISSSIKITKLPDKLTYNYKADGIDLSGIEITFKNSNGKTKKIDDIKLLTVSGFDSTKLGKQSVTVHYGQYKTTMQVTVRYSFWQMIANLLTFGLYQFI